MATRLKQGKSDLGVKIGRSHYADGFASSTHLFQTLESLATVLLASFGGSSIVDVEDANKLATFEIVIDASVMPTKVTDAHNTTTKGTRNVFVISH
jgi:hypothetical protein